MNRESVGAQACTTAADLEDGGGPLRKAILLMQLFPHSGAVFLRPGQGPWVIGRDPSCQVQAAARQLSRRHAEVLFKGPVVVLRDLQSTNGTFLNGVRITQAPLKPGSIVRCGQALLALVEVAADAILDEPFSALGGGLFGGPRLRAALEPLHKIARSDLPVLVQGDTGTGKEGTARLVHELSRRAGPFHAINCAALPVELAESLLFGHRPGAFTGASSAAVGQVRAADGGTLFLDEVQDLPLPVQAKLLRVIQEGEVIPVGSAAAVRVDVRFVSACQQSLLEGVGSGGFREDFYSRLAGFVVHLPTLRERVEDVPGLFLELLNKHARGKAPAVDAALLERLCLHSWPRNVRELEVVTRQVLALHGTEPMLKAHHAPDSLHASAPQQPSEQATNGDLLRLARALRSNAGNISRASTHLGISRSRAYRLMGDLSIDQVIGMVGTSGGDGDMGRAN